MFGIGGFELFLILIFGFLIFGPDKLPEIANTIGKAIAKFKGAQEDMTEQLKGATFVDKDSDSPLKNPLEVLENAASQTKGKVADARAKADAATDAVAGAADDAAAAAAKVGAAAGAAGAKVSTRTESFAERKARYDRERAARRQAEKEAAEAEAACTAAAEEAAKEARENPKTDVAAKSVVEEGD